MSEQETREQVSERLNLVQSLASLSKVYPHWAGLYGQCVDVIERQQMALAAKDAEIARLQSAIDVHVDLFSRTATRAEHAQREIGRLTTERDDLSIEASDRADMAKRLHRAEAALAAHHQQVRALVAEWRAMASDAFADGAIPGDVGHSARWHGVEFCADELEARLGLTADAPPQEGPKLVTVTSTPEHGLGFVVPTFVMGNFGGGYETLTCRDCHHETAYGHNVKCPQFILPSPASGAGD